MISLGLLDTEVALNQGEATVEVAEIHNENKSGKVTSSGGSLPQ